MTNVQQIIDAVKEAGSTTYLVGGAVRDEILGRPSKDTDLLVTEVPYEVLIEALGRIPLVKIDVVGKSFGVIKVTLGGETIDVALPRTERSTGMGHGDFTIIADPFLPVEQDLARRDFTMNAIAVREDGKVIDPFNGRLDIERGTVVAVGNATDRFNEDPLRMLRAVRFSSQLGFRLNSNCVHGIVANAALLSSVSPERVGEEMSKLLMGKDGESVSKALYRLVNYGLMEHVIPEFMPSVNHAQKNVHHAYTVEGHVFKAVEHAVSRGASLRARWAVLLHDIAKPATFTVDEKGQGHFYGHEEVGAEIATLILERLKFSNDFTAGVSKIVAEHLRPQNDSTDRVLRRYVAAMGELTEDGFMCREADLSAHAPAIAAGAVALFEEFRVRIANLKDISGFSEAKLALRGDEIAREFGVVGAGIGALKKRAAAAVVDGVVANEREALLAFLKGA